jgi:hypothetical protein
MFSNEAESQTRRILSYLDLRDDSTGLSREVTSLAQDWLDDTLDVSVPALERLERVCASTLAKCSAHMFRCQQAFADSPTEANKIRYEASRKSYEVVVATADLLNTSAFEAPLIDSHMDRWYPALAETEEE